MLCIDSDKGCVFALSGLVEANPNSSFEALVQERQRGNQNWEVDFQYENAETPNEGVVSLCQLISDPYSFVFVDFKENRGRTSAT